MKRLGRLTTILWVGAIFSTVFVVANTVLRPYITQPQPAIPVPMMPKTNAFDCYVAASRQMQGQTQLAYLKRLSPSQEATLVRKNAATLKILRRGLFLPYQPPPARSINDKFPFYRSQRDLSGLLIAEGNVRAAKGDWNGAAQSDLDSVQLGVQVVHGSPLLGCLVGIACQSNGRRSLWEVMNHLNAAEAQAAGQRLQDIQTRQIPFAETMQEEKWFGLAAMDEALEMPSWQKYPKFLKSIPLSNYRHYMDQSIANARHPYADHLADPIPRQDPVSVLFLPVFNQGHLDETNDRTQNALLRVALALHSYRLQRGSYPVVLNALIPYYLPAIPDDPFSFSGPLHYERTKTSYVLYSVGPDGKDNGGSPILHAPTALGLQAERSRHIVQDTSQGDIVARVNL